MAITTRDRNLVVGLVAVAVVDATAVAIGVGNGHGPHEENFWLCAIALIVLLVGSVIYLYLCMAGYEKLPTNEERDRCKTRCLLRFFLFIFIAVVAVVWWCEWYRPLPFEAMRNAAAMPTLKCDVVAALAPPLGQSSPSGDAVLLTDLS